MLPASPHPFHTLTQAVKRQAARLGFTLVGVSDPEPPAHLDVYERWITAGRHGEMAYMADERARQRRADPRQVLAECRSILVLGVPYITPPGVGRQAGRARPSQPSPNAQHLESGRGRVAAYAVGLDYHEVLPERLQALVDWLEAEVGQPIPNRWYTDTGPVLERELAQRAGLGWIGKNTCLIHPRRGSYFLLAEILLGLELEPDPPFGFDYCGGCTRCIDACPTQCILPDRTLDAHRCISYLTIELKGAIPIELRPQMGDWVFGCDICQQVCPWNQRFAGEPPDPEFAARPGQAEPDLVDLLALEPEAFNRRFKKTPLKRAKRRGLLRNAAVALGNISRDRTGPAEIEALVQALRDAEPLVRQHAAWALGQVTASQTDAGLRRQALQQAAESEQDATVLAEIQTALQ